MWIHTSTNYSFICKFFQHLHNSLIFEYFLSIYLLKIIKIPIDLKEKINRKSFIYSSILIKYKPTQNIYDSWTRIQTFAVRFFIGERVKNAQNSRPIMSPTFEYIIQAILYFTTTFFLFHSNRLPIKLSSIQRSRKPDSFRSRAKFRSRDHENPQENSYGMIHIPHGGGEESASGIRNSLSRCKHTIGIFFRRSWEASYLGVQHARPHNLHAWWNIGRIYGFG